MLLRQVHQSALTRPAKHVVDALQVSWSNRHNLVCRKVYGISMAYSGPVDDFTQRGRQEAAAKLSKNKEVVRAGTDGLSRMQTKTSLYGHLGMVTSVLLHRCSCLASVRM